MFFDGNGNFYQTNPGNADTDGDGISDGDELGEFFLFDGKRYYRLISDPTLADSDGDGLDDGAEYEYGTAPLFDDSDHDGVLDGAELGQGTNPLNIDSDDDGLPDGIDPGPADPFVNDLTNQQKASEFLQGVVLGDFVSGDMNHANWYFISGQLASGYFAIGDIRDTAGSLYNGQGDAAVLNMLALIPLAGDTEKTFVRIDRAIAKNPQLTQDIVNLVINGHVIQDEMSVIRHVYTDAKINSLLEYADETALRTVVSQNGDLSKAIQVITSESGDVRTIWLEDGKLGSALCSATWIDDRGGSGWVHIRNNHVIKPSGNDFAGAFGSEYNDESNIKELILNAAQYGTEVQDSKGLARIYEVPNTGGEHIRIGIGDNGYIITAYPE